MLCKCNEDVDQDLLTSSRGLNGMAGTSNGCGWNDVTLNEAVLRTCYDNQWLRECERYTRDWDGAHKFTTLKQPSVAELPAAVVRRLGFSSGAAGEPLQLC